MNKKQSSDPFSLLLETVPVVTPRAPTKKRTDLEPKSDFKFNSLLRSNNKRQTKRAATTGFVYIYSKEGKVLAKAVLRNMSIGGFGIETYPIELAVKTNVFVEFSGYGATLGRFKCQVSWVASIDDHPDDHKMIGFNIAETSAEFKSNFNAFFTSLGLVKTN